MPRLFCFSEGGRIHSVVIAGLQTRIPPHTSAYYDRLSKETNSCAAAPKTVKDIPLPPRCRCLFRTGRQLHLPVSSLLAYKAFRGIRSWPLFIFSDGGPLTRVRLVQEVQRELSSAGLDCSVFTGHSFRIAAASTAKARDVDDSTIKELGWWKSKVLRGVHKDAC